MSGQIEPWSKAKHDRAFEKHKKVKQDLHPRFSEQESNRRPTRAAARATPQYRDDDNSPSSDIDIAE